MVPFTAFDWRRVVAMLLGALALCWAAAVNGGPFLHPDSIGYVRGPDVAVMKLVGEKYATAWARFDPARPPTMTMKSWPADRSITASWPISAP